MKAIDMTKIYRDYKGKWVALTLDYKTVITSGKTLKEILEDSKKKGFEHPLVTQIPKYLNVLHYHQYEKRSKD